ncbi:MAG: hypothetical protein ACK5P7_04940 [Bdellovibrio sp.]|jgi:hypothetical protein
MRHSNLTLWRLIFALGFMALAACSLPAPQKRDLDHNASFFVDSVRPEFTTQSTHASFSIPIARTLSVKACLKENKQSRPVINHAFEISGDDFATQTVSSDLEGCFVFTEEISYNAMASAQSILVERQAKAVGVEKGSRLIQVVINPWSGEALSLKDSRVRANSYVTQAQAREALKGRQAPARALVLDGMRITLQPLTIDGLQRKASLDLTGVLSYEGQDVGGSRTTFPLTRGQFKFQYTLYYQTDQESKTVRRVIKKSPVLIVNDLVQGSLSISEQFDLPAGGLCRSGVVYLGVKVEPIDSPVGLKKLEGVFYYGTCEARGTAWGTAVSDFKNRFERDPALTIETYLEEAAPKTVDQPVQTQALEIRPLSISTISFEQSGGVNRKRNLQIQSCLRSGWDRAPVRLAELEIQTLSGEKKRVMTNDEGCFIVDDQVSFNYYAQECWKSGSVQISHKNTNFTQKIDLHYNPWMQGDAFRDARFLDASAKVLRCAQGQAEIMLSSFYFSKQQFHYKIDPYLNLEIQKQGPFNAGLKLKRPSLSDPSGFTEEFLPPGLYGVRLAVVDQFLRDFDQAENKVFYVMEKVLPVRANSQISEEIQLATKNIKALGNTNQLIIEVLPLKANAGELLAQNPQIAFVDLIDKTSNLKIASFRAPLNFSNGNDAGTFTMIDDPDTGSLVTKLKEQLTQDEKALAARSELSANTKNFASSNKLTLINLNDEAATAGFRQALAQPLKFANPRVRMNERTQISTADLKKTLDTGIGDQLKVNLCAYWFNDFWLRPLPNKTHGVLAAAPSSSSFILTSECHRLAQQNLRSVFDVETKYFVKNPRLLSVSENSTPFRDFSISQSFSLNKGHSDSVSQSWNWNVGLGLDLLKISSLPFSASTGAGYSVSKSSSVSEGQGTSVSYSGSIGVLIETLKLNLEIPEYEKCLVIKLNPNLFVKKEDGFFSSGNPWVKSFHPKLSAEEMEHYARAGYLICDGQNRQETLKTSESFYVINQRVSGGQIIDDSTETSRPFFVTMRGDLDLIRFLSYLHGSQSIPTSFESEFQRSQMLGTDASQAVFIRGVKSAPGVLTRIEGSGSQTN